jgi:hypothetical protein
VPPPRARDKKSRGPGSFSWAAPLENRQVRRWLVPFPPMCIICIDFERGALKPKEARRALGEMREKLDPAHVAELEKKLADAEQNPPPSSGTP